MSECCITHTVRISLNWKTDGVGVAGWNA